MRLTGQINLTSGKKYVSFLSASNFFDGVSGLSRMGSTRFQGGDVYSGGDFVYNNNGSNFNSLTANNWVSGRFGDAAFKASFSSQSVPEPASILGMLAFGAVGATSALKRKQKNNKA